MASPVELTARAISLDSLTTWAKVPLYRVVAICVATLLIYAVATYLKLRHIPGPLPAAISNLPRWSWVRSNKAHDVHIALHRRYGKLVRLGPNMVSVADPAEIPNIYSFAGKFPKSDFYHVLKFYARGKPVETIFATQNEDIHRSMKQPIAAIYSMSNLVSFETYVDSTMTVFFQRLEDLFVKTGTTCDLGEWVQFFAFDVMGEITFSKRLGFLETGEDVSNIIGNLWKYFKKAAPVTQIPWVDSLWTKNPIFQHFQTVSRNPIVEFAIARAAERQQLNNLDEEVKANNRDFLSRFLEAQTKNKHILPGALTAWTTSNVAAGSDTTAIFFRTTFWNLLTHPRCLQQLRDELKEAKKENRLSDLVTWKESQSLPYLDAVIKESGRIHPPFGLHLERVVPPSGATICGQFFQGGTVVGISPWVMNHEQSVFGDDADEWRPERWLECDKEKRRSMESALFTFGGGHRVCLGKNIFMLEAYKLIPSFLQAFEMELADENPKLEVENRWFVNQKGLNVRLQRRVEAS